MNVEQKNTTRTFEVNTLQIFSSEWLPLEYKS